MVRIEIDFPFFKKDCKFPGSADRGEKPREEKRESYGSSVSPDERKKNENNKSSF